MSERVDSIVSAVNRACAESGTTTTQVLVPRRASRRTRVLATTALGLLLATLGAVWGFGTLGERGSATEKKGDNIDAQRLLDESRSLVQDPRRIDEGITKLKDAYAAQPELDGLRSFYARALRSRIPSLSEGGKPSEALKLARDLVGVDASEQSRVHDLEIVVRESILRSLNVVSPVVNQACASARVKVEGTVGYYDVTNTVSVQGKSVDVFAGKFSIELVGMPDGPQSIEVVAKDSNGVEAKLVHNFAVDTQDPVLSITSPLPGSYVTPQVVFAGTVHDATIVKVSAAGHDSESVNGAWSQTHVLEEGERRIDATFVDRAGHETKSSVTFIVDATAPDVHLLNRASSKFDAASNDAVVEFAVSDNLKLGSLTWDGQPVVPSDGRVRVLVSDLLREGELKKHLLVVRDAAGNATTHEIQARLDRTKPVITKNPVKSWLFPGKTRLIAAINDAGTCSLAGHGVERALSGGIIEIDEIVGEAPGTKARRAYVVSDAAGNQSDLCWEFDVVARCADCAPNDDELGVCSRCTGLKKVSATCTACKGDPVRTDCRSCGASGLGTCDRCNGGFLPLRQCPTCVGSSTISCRTCGGDGRLNPVKCTSCNGLGTANLGGFIKSNFPCPTCSGDRQTTPPCTACKGGRISCTNPECTGGNVKERCGICKGSGRFGRCNDCKGEGRVDQTCTQCKGTKTESKPCLACRETGRCSSCDGTGRADRGK